MGILGNLKYLIMQCVITPIIWINWNDVLMDEFIPLHGIIQGDPLSSYIFVICMERLAHSFTWEEVSRGNWKPIKLSREGPTLSHLLLPKICFYLLKLPWNK